ncbi:MAG: lytic murein transglycosylase [Alphaproteobacteria bacterium]|nr:lytic murein transglycosylase [Alphaproteobacteria bacterium]
MPTVGRHLALLLPLLWATLLPWSAGATQQSFADWLHGVRREAAQRGVRPQTLEVALAGLAPIPRVLELDRKQPETTLTFQQYYERVVSQARIEHGRRQHEENRLLLGELTRKYRVPGQFIVALWGVETDYGRITGGYPVIAALATLAYDSRRSSFFRQELLHALRILDEGHVQPKAMLGSWAGAMGQNQFMPSSFLSYAVDHDGDGRRDIWQNRGDALASIANYLARVGWAHELDWGVEVVLPSPYLADRSATRPWLVWQDEGVRLATGRPPPDPLLLTLVLPERGAQNPAYLVTQNFQSLMRWNRSNYFALSVGLLADAIAAGR